MKNINIEINDLNEINVKMEGLITHRDIRNIHRAIVVKFRQVCSKNRLELSNKVGINVKIDSKTNTVIKENTNGK